MVFFNDKDRGPYSQHFTFFVNYEGCELARVFLSLGSLFSQMYYNTNAFFAYS
jgi:hypothetical protein